MRVYKDIELYELQDEVMSEKLDTLVDVFADADADESALDDALSFYIYDIDRAENAIEEHYCDIVRKYLEIKESKLNPNAMDKLGLTFEQCQEEGIPVEFLKDERGRAYIMADENPAQMSFLDGGKVRRYINADRKGLN